MSRGRETKPRLPRRLILCVLPSSVLNPGPVFQHRGAEDTEGAEAGRPRCRGQNGRLAGGNRASQSDPNLLFTIALWYNPARRAPAIVDVGIAHGPGPPAIPLAL